MEGRGHQRGHTKKDRVGKASRKTWEVAKKMFMLIYRTHGPKGGEGLTIIIQMNGGPS